MKQNIKKYIMAAVPALLLAACNGNTQGNKPVLTVTIEPLRYFTEQIGGDRFSVMTMVPKGSNPESYEPTAQQMVALSNSALYIKVGDLGLERTWMKRLQANAPHLTIIDTSKGIKPVFTEDGKSDPHTWTSPANALIIAENIYRALVMLTPKDSLYLRANFERLNERIKSIDRYIRALPLTEANRTFIIYHPALTYFAHEYGFEQIAIEHGGREPSAQWLQYVIGQTRKRPVGTLLVQTEFMNRNTQIVAEGTHLPVVEINPLNYHWDKEMLKTANALCKK